MIAFGPPSQSEVSDSAASKPAEETPTKETLTESSLEMPCAHCGAPVHGAAGRDLRQVFCCNGCRAAFELVHGLGLEDFYALREQCQVEGTATAAQQHSRYDQFDSEEFLGDSAPQSRPDGSRQVKLAVQGLHCGACAWLIENALSREAGLLSVRVKMSEHTISLIFDPEQTRLSHLARQLDRLGYQLSPLDPARDDRWVQENRRLLIQIAIAGFFAANAMWIAIALYGAEFTGVAPEYRYFLGIVGTLLGVSSVLGPGRTFLVGALASFRTRTPHMDLPVALGLSVGTLVGTVNAFTGQGHVYFDSLATLVFLLLIGRWIQFRQQQRAAKAVDLLLRITPRHAEREQADGSTRTVLADGLLAGDIIHVAAAESVAADGEILSGETTLDRSLLTGESIPVPASEGDSVAAGMVNLSGPIRVCVSAAGAQSRIGRVMQTVEAATTERAPVVLLADRTGGYFVVTVLILALLTFVGWSLTDVSEAIANATALLIVACPCALALATPLAIAVALGRAARRGILIREGSSLQKLSKPGRIWLDKTGTLTEGRQRVTHLIGSQDGLRLAAAIEGHCKHPIANALVREAELRGVALPEATSVQMHAGGISGMAENRQVRAGNLRFMRDQNVVLPDDMIAEAEQLAAAGQSPLLVAIDDRVVSLLGLSDPIRAGAAEVIGQFQKAGWQVGILSGDHAQITRRVGQKLGLAEEACLGGLSPEDKLQIVKQKSPRGDAVAMVGDGANDAAALAAADVGIAVRGGAEVSLQAAPIFVATGQLNSLLQLVHGARRTTKLIWSTFAVSLSYNAVAVVLAMTGSISPLVAALLMPASSVTVLGITLASKTFRGSP